MHRSQDMGQIQRLGPQQTRVAWVQGGKGKEAKRSLRRHRHPPLLARGDGRRRRPPEARPGAPRRGAGRGRADAERAQPGAPRRRGAGLPRHPEGSPGGARRRSRAEDRPVARSARREDRRRRRPASPPRRASALDATTERGGADGGGDLHRSGLALERRRPRGLPGRRGLAVPRRIGRRSVRHGREQGPGGGRASAPGSSSPPCRRRRRPRPLLPAQAAEGRALRLVRGDCRRSAASRSGRRRSPPGSASPSTACRSPWSARWSICTATRRSARCAGRCGWCPRWR